MDSLTAQKRHDNMAAIRSKDTKPELIVRRGLWKRGFRYRLNHKRLPGHRDFWVSKIKRNKERDKEEQKRLAEMGWHCITVWECELKPQKREETLNSIAFTLNHIWMQDHGVKPKDYNPYTHEGAGESQAMVAEDEAD